MSPDIVNERGEILIPDPPIAHALFETVRFSWLWLLLRFYLAYTWLSAAWGKLNNPAWMDGKAIQGFWQNAVSVSETGSGQITFDWYRTFLQYMIDSGWNTWFGPLMAYAELTVGLLLLLGAFTGIAAFMGAFLNMNFMLAGVASTNPVLFTISILVMLAWKVAGWWGLDRWLLPLLGTPWMRSVATVDTNEGKHITVTSD